MQTPTLKGWVDGKQFTETEGAAMSVEYRVVITRIQKKKKIILMSKNTPNRKVISNEEKKFF